MRVIAFIIVICLANALLSTVCAAEPAEAPSGIMAKGCKLEAPSRCLELAQEFVNNHDDISAFEAFAVACAAHNKEGCQGSLPMMKRLVERGWLLGNFEVINIGVTIKENGLEPNEFVLRVSRLWVHASQVRRLCNGTSGDYEVSEVRQFSLVFEGSSQAPKEFSYAVIAGLIPLVDRVPVTVHTPLNNSRHRIKFYVIIHVT